MIKPRTPKRSTFAVLLLLPALGLGLSAIASAQALPYRSGFGSELVYQCKAYVRMISGPQSANDIAEGRQCLGYVDGFVDGVNSEFGVWVVGNHKDWTASELCIPPGTLDTWIKVYLAFMEKNPKYLDEDKGTSLRMALHDAYPCGK